MTNTTTGSATPGRLALLGAAAAWLALLGPTWSYVPAAGETPAMSLDFASLIAMNAENPDALASAFYGWMSWLFAVVLTVLAVLMYRRPSAVLSAISIAAGVVLLIVSFIVFKGPLTIAQLIDGLPYVRLGSILFFASFCLLVAAGIVALLEARRSDVSAAKPAPAGVPATA